MENRSILPGAILIAIGVGLLVTRFVEVSGGIVVLLIGAAFLVAWAISRTYGLLIPGAIMAGLGLGILAEEQGVGGDTVVPLGLGLGFLAIWVLDRIWSRSGPPHGDWWPFIPGGILTVVGVVGLLEDSEAIMELVIPAAMVVVGLVLAIRALRARSHHQAPPVPPGQAPPVPPGQAPTPPPQA